MTVRRPTYADRVAARREHLADLRADAHARELGFEDADDMDRAMLDLEEDRSHTEAYADDETRDVWYEQGSAA